MSILKTVVDGAKELVFAETEDAGKVSQIFWSDEKSGLVTVHVPVAAYDRYAKRAALRAVRIKVPNAVSADILKVWPQVVRLPEGSYYLVRVFFKV
jgi:hypothetical protein